MSIATLPDGTAVTSQAFLQACRTDPNTFTEYVLDVQQAPIHREIQSHYTDHNEAGIGVHRGAGKTVQTMARVAWEIGRDPTQRWKYIQATPEEANQSVDFIKRIVETSRYRQVFPEVRPDPDLWGTKAFRLKSDSIHRDPTVQARGIFGHAGGRATRLVFDDICDLENAVRRAALRSQVKEAYHNTWMKMLTGDDRRVWCIFTPWHVDDITSEWRPYFTDQDALLWRPVVDYISPWPSEWTVQRLRAEEDRNPIAYARAFLLEPVSAEVLVWPAEWLDGAMFTEIPAARRASGYWAQTLDYAFSDKRIMKARGSTDPDWSIALIAFIDSHGHAWVHDMLRVRSTFPQFSRGAIALGRHWNVRKGKGEAVGGQRGLVQQMNEDAPYPIEAVERINDKTFRAGSLQSFVSSGRFHILGQDGKPAPQLQALYNEMTTFPAGGHDDTVDAAMDMMEMATVKSVKGQVRRIESDRSPAHTLYGIR